MIQSVLETLSEVFYNLFIFIWLKDPCKKCLVKACCSKDCKKKEVFDYYSLFPGTLNMNRILSWFLLISLIFSVASYIIPIIKYYGII